MNLTQFLEATGMPLTEVARMAGVNYGHLHNVKTGKSALGLDVARKLAAIQVDGSDARMTLSALLKDGTGGDSGKAA